MRKTLSPLFAALLMFLLFSCSSDDLESDELSIETADLAATVNRSSSPCKENLLAMVSNSTLSVDCLSDLNGQTINLPKGVNLDFKGGTLSNGTLNFNDGTIDGRLLGRGLKITGNAQLANKTLTFEPKQWGIIEGKTSKANAKNNREGIMEAINHVKELGGNTMEIGKLDAYFEIGNEHDDPNWYSSEEGISLPSNFKLKMSDNTHLRVYPNDTERYSLIGLKGVKNVVVEGGHLHGDRDDHIYKRGSTHEWGSMIEILGAQNSTIRNVSMYMATGDGMKIHSLRFTFQPDYLPAKNIVVDNCYFSKNRRNNLTITDGQDLIIENSTFKDAGVNTSKSKGTNPRFSIDIEAHRERENGKLKYFERVDGVIIRNNTSSGGARGGFLVSIGDNVTLENNTMSSNISYRYARGCIIRNNTLKSPRKGSGTALRGGMAGTNTVYNNKIYGNKVTDYAQGILLYGNGHNVYNNEIINSSTGIFVKDIKDSKINNNKIKSNLSRSRGIFAHFTTVEDSEFKSNEINVTGSPFDFTYVNRTSAERDYKILVKDNEFNSNYFSNINNAHNITLENNEVNTSIKVTNAGNIDFYRNSIDGSQDRFHTIHFGGNSKKIKLFYNRLTAKKWTKNTYEAKTQNSREIQEGGNTWRYR